MKTQPTADTLSRHPLEFREAVEHFHANRKKIAKKYEEHFVAILEDRVVDCDSDYGNLIARVERSFPNRHPYLGYAARNRLRKSSRDSRQQAR